MSSPNKAAGTRWESRVVSYLSRYWPDICRRALAGRFDKGDIQNGPPGWTIECKTAGRLDFPLFLRQAKAEAENNGHHWYVAIVKNRRGKFSTGGVEDAFAVMPLHLWRSWVYRMEQLVGVLDSVGGEVPPIE